MTTRMKQLVGFAASLGFAASMAFPVISHAAMSATEADKVFGITAVEGSGIALGSGDVRETAGRIINVALGFLGIIAVVIVLVGGFKYMVSGGSEEKTQEARNLIFAGVIGLAIILSAWAITQFVIRQLIGATQNS